MGRQNREELMHTASIGRRTLLQGAGVAALAATGAMTIGKSRAEGEVPWSTGTDLPKTTAPDFACDCHMHIYDARFPAAASATLRPADAHVEDYRLLQRRTG